MTRGRTTTQRGYGHAWHKLREQAFEAYGRACYLCGAYARTVDHLDPIARYGTELPSLDRVRPCCLRCNVIRSNRARGRRQRPKPAAVTQLRW